MFHYNSLIRGETELEVASSNAERMRFFNPVLDKRAARSDFRDHFLPSLVNVNRRILVFVAGVADAVAAFRDRGYRMGFFGLGPTGVSYRDYRLPVAQGVQIFDHFVERCLVERLDRADHCHFEM